MAYNDRIEIESGDVSFGQLAPSKASQTNFTPGITNGKPQDMNWPKDFRIPTGTPAFDGEAAGPVEMARNRVTKLGRNIVCDQTLPVPVVLDSRLETRVEDGITGASLVDDTELPASPAVVERKTGFDNIKGA